MRKRILNVALCSASITTLALTSPATAQDTEKPAGHAGVRSDDAGRAIADIVVTATRTGATEVQHTPLAVSVYSPQTLATSGVSDIRDLVQLTPNLKFSQTAAFAQIYIRGIGSNNLFIGSDPSVTTHVDGVYIARGYSQITDFIDIERVEVLRGPQGTLYGRNAVGGTINIISRKPSDRFEGQVQLAGGTYGQFQGQAYVSGPIAPGLLQVSLAGNYIRHDDYFENIVPGGQNVGSERHGGVRGQIRFTPSSSLELITRADWSKSEGHLLNFSKTLAPFPPARLANSILGDDRKVALNTPQPITTENWGISQEINLELSPQISLKSLSAYRKSSYATDVDIDATELNLISGSQSDHSKVVTQELNLNAKFGHFKGLIGLYYYHEDEDGTLRINLYGPKLVRYVAPILENRSYAAFAQATYDITDQLSLTAGIRYTNDHKTVDQHLTVQPLATFPNGPNIPPFPFIGQSTQKAGAWTPKFGINYQITPRILLYGSITKGFKSGGTNYAADRPGNLDFGPESLWAYEAGIKSDFLDRRLRVNVAGFWYDYRDLQVQSLLSPGVTTISNAATARVKGLEIETTARPLRHVTLTANYSLLNSRYRHFEQASVPAVLIPYLAGNPRYNAALQTYDASGNRLNSAPTDTFTATAQIEQPIGSSTAYVRAEYFWQSRTFFDPTNVAIASQPSFGLVTLGLGLRNETAGWSAQLIAKNVTNKEYLVAVGTNGVVPAGQIAPPRTILFQISKSW